MFLSNGPTNNQRQSSSLINNIPLTDNRDNNTPMIGMDDELINLDLESLSLSPKSRSSTRQTRRNAESAIELTYDNDNPLTHIFGQSSSSSLVSIRLELI